MAAGRPVSRAQIRAVVAGYADSPSGDAFERMFERDKDELRGMGIPVETVVNAGGEVEGYRIRREDYALPPVRFSAEELAVLGLAARAWEQASLGPAAAAALRKLEASGGGVAAPDGLGVTTRVAPADAAFLPLSAAVRHRREVRFDYRRPGQEEVLTRRVHPWGLVSRRGRWYLVGFDLDRDAERVFRLSRIVGTPRPVGDPGAFDLPAGVDPRDLVGRGGDPDRGPVRAVVRLRPGAAHRLRRWGAPGGTRPAGTEDAVGEPAAGAPAAGDLVVLAGADEESLAAEIAAVGDAAVVVSPAEVRAAVLRRLRHVRDAHAPGAHS
ncbi:MAG: WYL domain-containing protein [Candidatus Nanopelagicales bacterium]